MSRIRASAVGLTFCALAVAALNASAANKTKGKENTPTAPGGNELADDVFKKCDTHNLGYLTKQMFKKADKMVADAINSMVQQGTIGKLPAKGKGPASPPTFQPGFATADADNDKKVTLIEFTTYVNSAIQAADQYYQYVAAHSPKPKTSTKYPATTATP